MPQGFLGDAGGQKFNFLNMDMWHIKLKVMSSRPPEYTENFYPRIKLLTLGWGLTVKQSNTIRFSSRAWEFVMAHH